MIDITSVVYPLSGLLVGLLVGLTGVGGGSLMTPLLLAFGVHPTTAVGTDLLYAAVTKTVGTGVHSASKTVDWKIVRRLALGSVPTTALTLFALSHFNSHSKEVTSTIKFVLGVALLLTALSIFFRRRVAEWVATRFGEPSDSTARTLTIVSGAVLGVLVSLSSVGAGALGVTALIMLYPRLPTVSIVGSDIAHAVPLTLLAGFGHWLLGDVNWGLMGSLLIGSIPGILLGSWLAPRMPEYGLRPALASVLTLVGANLVHIHLF
ncbi:MAG TPA: sulfite exporter TauE/SafE family protein [Acetobacteraceae bacterium]|nr:sulfite exporter TauE/SafE family protein [Acetobacteraceae bacterium]